MAFWCLIVALCFGLFNCGFVVLLLKSLLGCLFGAWWFGCLGLGVGVDRDLILVYGSICVLCCFVVCCLLVGRTDVLWCFGFAGFWLLPDKI